MESDTGLQVTGIAQHDAGGADSTSALAHSSYASESLSGQRNNGQFKKPNQSARHKQKRKNNNGGRKASQDGAKTNDNPYHWQQVKRRKLDATNDEPSYMSIPFSADEIAAEERRPKRKVAVLFGYAGTGYHGLQINHKQKTIEGELFAVFVDVGAISKANASDPLKSKLIRCARTDRGVHAAGNVISLNLIIEDEDLVQKLNDRLPPQIRIWGIQRTNSKFNSHQACDSRWYEYLLPSYALLPPHPCSFLSKKITETASEKGVEEEYRARLGDVHDFWSAVERAETRPILNRLGPQVREEVLAALHAELSSDAFIEDGGEPRRASNSPEATGAESRTKNDSGPQSTEKVAGEAAADENEHKEELTPSELAVREIKTAWMKARRRYRVSPERIAQLQAALQLFVGTNNFHNYTVNKAFKEASAKRHIKRFEVAPEPIVRGDTEWLSLRVHGQSFMMHQIRKMVAVAAMLVRTGAPLDTITESYGPRRISIPKAPGLGLLLERPVFESYNRRAADTYARDAIDFAKYDKEIADFKGREIYDRMFEREDKDHIFHSFFNQVDNFRSDFFLWCTPAGLPGSFQRRGPGEVLPKGLADDGLDSGDEGEDADDKDQDG